MPQQDYPELNVSDRLRTEIASYLAKEIHNVKTGRTNFETLWEEIEKYYHATEIEEKRDIPWPGAATIMIQVMATYIQQVYSKLTRTLNSPEDRFAVLPTRDDISRVAKPLRKYITWSCREELKMAETMEPCYLQLFKLGTTAAKAIYVREERMIRDETGILVTDTIENRPRIVPIPIPDLFFPLETRDFGRARWKAHRVRKSWNELVIGARNKFFRSDAVEQLRGWTANHRTMHEQAVDVQRRIDPLPTDEYEIYEVWFEYVLKEESAGGGELNTAMEMPRKLVCWIHPESYTILRLQDNWFPLQLDPFEVEVCEPEEFRVYGTGIGEMSLPIQKEVSIMHCQRLDGATVSNSVGAKVKSDVLQRYNVELFPGCKVPVDEMDDFEPFQLGSKFDSTINEEQHTLQLLQQRVGVNDAMNGGENLSRVTATTALAAQQEAQGRFDSVLERARSLEKRLMEKILLLEKRYGDDAKYQRILGPEDGAMVGALFRTLSYREIYDGVGLSVTATTSATSKELERQNKMGLFGLLTQYYDRYVQYMGMGLSPQTPPEVREVVLKLLASMSQFIYDILDDFNLHRKGELILSLEQLDQLPAQLGPGAASAQPGAASGMAPVFGPPAGRA